MRYLRFTTSRLMVIVAVAAVLSAVWAAIEKYRERSRWAAVRIVNRRPTPLKKVVVIYPDGRREIPAVPARGEVEIPIRVESEAQVRILIDGQGGASFGGVRGGSKPTITFDE